MSQVWVCTREQPSTSETRYWCIFGECGDDQSHGSYINITCTMDGILTSIATKVVTAPGAGKSIEFRVMKNGLSTSLCATISDSETEALGRSMVIVSAGDTLHLRVRCSGSPTVSRTNASLVFWTPDNTENIIAGNVSPGTSNFAQLMGYDYSGGASNEICAEFIAAWGADLSDLWVKLSTAPGSGKSRTFTLRVNEQNTSMTVTISNTSTVGHYTGSAVTVSAGDRICLQCTKSGSPASSRAWYSVKVATFPDCSLVGGANGYYYLFNDGAYEVEYAPAVGYDESHPDNDDYPAMAPADMTITAMFVKVDTAPGEGENRTCKLMKRSSLGVESETGMVVTIEDDDTEGSDTEHSVSFSRYDSFYLKWSKSEGADDVAAGATFGFLVDTTHLPPVLTTDRVVKSIAYGTISDAGDGESCSVRGFCYMEAEEGDPNVFDNSYVIDGSLSTDGEFGIGEYSLELPLEAGKLYRVRAFAVNDNELAYGDTMPAYFEYPSNSMARVSSIRRVYHPGLYRMEVALGDLGFDVDVAEAAIKKISDKIKETEKPSAEQLEAWRQGAMEYARELSRAMSMGAGPSTPTRPLLPGMPTPTPPIPEPAKPTISAETSALTTAGNIAKAVISLLPGGKNVVSIFESLFGIK